MFKRKSYSLNQRPGCNTQEACGADGISLQAVPLLPTSRFHTSFRWDSTWIELDVSVYSCLSTNPAKSTSDDHTLVFWFLTKFGAVEQIYTRFVLWNHKLVVHHSALTAFRFGLFVNQDARIKCPHTRSSPGQHRRVSSHEEHFCCKCICFNNMTLKIERVTLTFSPPQYPNVATLLLTNMRGKRAEREELL